MQIEIVTTLNRFGWQTASMFPPPTKCAGSHRLFPLLCPKRPIHGPVVPTLPPRTPCITFADGSPEPFADSASAPSAGAARAGGCHRRHAGGSGAALPTAAGTSHPCEAPARIGKICLQLVVILKRSECCSSMSVLWHMVLGCAFYTVVL